MAENGGNDPKPATPVVWATPPPDPLPWWRGPILVGLLALLWFFPGGLPAFLIVWSIEGDDPTPAQIALGSEVGSAYVLVVVGLLVWWVIALVRGRRGR
jgi:hypothetical protein